MLKLDLIVIGGGPAGAASAIRYLQLEPRARVIILDKAVFPRDKPCGDGLGPDAVSEIALLGASRVLVGRKPISSILLQSPSGRRVTGSPPRPGYVIPRLELDAGMIDVALSTGARVSNERVESIEHTKGGVVVNGSYVAPVVIAADGANSRCRTILGQDRAPDDHAAFAVRGYAESESRLLEIRWERTLYPSYSWIFPVGDGRVNIGFGCLHKKLDGDKPKEVLWRALAESVELKPIEGTLRAHRLPFTSARLTRSCGSVLFAGDAAGMINPLSGEGIYYALATGRLAATAAAQHGGSASRAYENAIQRTFKSHFRATSLAHVLQRVPRNVDAAVKAAESSWPVFEDLVDLALGHGGLTVATTFGVARHWLTRL